MKPIPELLRQLADLLDQHGDESWAAGLRILLAKYHEDSHEAVADIRRLYGGMGSFNDLILQNGNGMVRSENDELDRLRSALYTACEE